MAALVCLSGCAVPLAPGYKIEKQSIIVRFVPGAPPHLAVRAEYRLANVGNSNLDSIEVCLPGRKSFGRENLRVQVQGHDVTPMLVRGADADEGESASSESWPVVWRIPFSPAWHRKQKRNLLIAYDLTAAAEPGGRMYVAPSMFLLNDSGWFPDPLAPKSLFAKDLVRPDPSDLRIIVPVDFQALGSGEPQGVKNSNAGAEYRFRLGKNDFDPFIVAGKYYTQQIMTSAGPVVFWTTTPLAPASARASALQIATARKFYETTFGPLPESMKAITLADSSFGTGENAGSSAADNYILPGVILALTPAQKPGVLGTTPLPGDFSLDLAATWFQKLIIPQKDAWLLADALSAYAYSLTSPDSHNRADRERAIEDLLQNYDARASRAIEKPIASLAREDPPAQIQISAAKVELFLFGLEDSCGRDNVNHALAHMASALRFQQYGYIDLRSALEQECHQDLGPFFRSWLNEKGIPADFRAKYEPASQKKD